MYEECAVQVHLIANTLGQEPVGKEATGMAKRCLGAPMFRISVERLVGWTITRNKRGRVVVQQDLPSPVSRLWWLQVWGEPRLFLPRFLDKLAGYVQGAFSAVEDGVAVRLKIFRPLPTRF